MIKTTKKSSFMLIVKANYRLKHRFLFKNVSNNIFLGINKITITVSTFFLGNRNNKYFSRL